MEQNMEKNNNTLAGNEKLEKCFWATDLGPRGREIWEVVENNRHAFVYGQDIIVEVSHGGARALFTPEGAKKVTNLRLASMTE
jgi:hypothetical protein